MRIMTAQARGRVPCHCCEGCNTDRQGICVHEMTVFVGSVNAGLVQARPKQFIHKKGRLRVLLLQALQALQACGQDAAILSTTSCRPLLCPK
jgi:hypothetical protein